MSPTNNGIFFPYDPHWRAVTVSDILRGGNFPTYQEEIPELKLEVGDIVWVKSSYAYFPDGVTVGDRGTVSCLKEDPSIVLVNFQGKGNWCVKINHLTVIPPEGQL
jgi:hypothetical protein